MYEVAGSEVDRLTDFMTEPPKGSSDAFRSHIAPATSLLSRSLTVDIVELGNLEDRVPAGTRCT